MSRPRHRYRAGGIHSGVMGVIEAVFLQDIDRRGQRIDFGNKVTAEIDRTRAAMRLLLSKERTAPVAEPVRAAVRSVVGVLAAAQ
jgi:hypothetical protein